jgi:TonB family protein
MAWVDAVRNRRRAAMVELSTMDAVTRLGLQEIATDNPTGDGRKGIRGVVFRSGLADRDPLPLLRVDPHHPPQAQQTRLEGWVQVRFTVSSAGSIEDAGVVESSDRVFEKSALQAIAKWKFQPSLRAGKPVETPDQRVVLRFQQPEGKAGISSGPGTDPPRPSGCTTGGPAHLRSSCVLTPFISLATGAYSAS